MSLTLASYFFPLVLLLLPRLPRPSFPAHRNWTVASPALPAQTRSDLVKRVPLAHLYPPRVLPHVSSPPLVLLLFFLLFSPLSPHSGSVFDAFLLQQRKELLPLDVAAQLSKLRPKLQQFAEHRHLHAHILSRAVRHSVNQTLVRTHKKNTTWASLKMYGPSSLRFSRMCWACSGGMSICRAGGMEELIKQLMMVEIFCWMVVSSLWEWQRSCKQSGRASLPASSHSSSKHLEYHWN